MYLLARILAWTFGLMFVGAGVVTMIAPGVMGPLFGVDTQGPIGLSTLRGILGGVFLGSGSLMLLGLLRGEVIWFQASAIAVGMIAFGRVIGFVFDGPVALTALPFSVECSVVLVMLAVSRRLVVR